MPHQTFPRPDHSKETEQVLCGELGDREYGIKESGVRSWRSATAKKNRMRIQDSSKPKNHNYRKSPNRRHN